MWGFCLQYLALCYLNFGLWVQCIKFFSLVLGSLSLMHTLWWNLKAYRQTFFMMNSYLIGESGIQYSGPHWAMWRSKHCKLLPILITSKMDIAVIFFFLMLGEWVLRMAMFWCSQWKLWKRYLSKCTKWLLYVVIILMAIGRKGNGESELAIDMLCVFCKSKIWHAFWPLTEPLFF